MRTRHHPAAQAATDLGGAPAESVQVHAWERPVRALAVAGAPPSVLTGPLPSTWHDLTDGQRHLTMAIVGHLGLPLSAAAEMVELQRERLRAAALRRSDDIETLTGLIRLLIGCPLTTAAEVAAIHHAYQHLRLCHWWPTGPEDLPLAALLVADGNPDELVRRIESLHLVLSEGDEIPGDPCTLVALCLSVGGLDHAQVLLRLCSLRTELLLSGVAVQDQDIAVLPVLAAIDGHAEALMQEFITERRLIVGSPTVRATPSAIDQAVDTVVLRHLFGASRQAHLAALVIRAWMAHRHLQRHRPVWLAGIRS